MKTPRPLSVASRHSLVHRLRLSYERGLVASVVTAVSRSYATLALGILLLGYLSTELLPHRALSLGLALCGGGAFLYGALVSFAEGTRLSHYVAQVGRTRALRLGLTLLLLLIARLYYAHSVEAITEVRLPLHTPLRAVLTEEEVQDATLRLRIRLLAEGNIPTALLQLTCRRPDSASIRVGDTLTLSLDRLSYVRELPAEREGYARYLLSEGVTALGRAHILAHQPTPSSTLLLHAPTRYAHRLRDGLTAHIQASALSPYAQHLLIAMALGEKRHDALGREVSASFVRGGVAHLLAVSGFHLAVVIGVLTLLLRYIPYVRRRDRLRCALLLAAAWAFTLLTGASIPTLRAAGMLTMYLGFRLLRRPVCLLEVFTLPALLQLLYAPTSLFSASFLMTYLAIISIRLFYRPIEGLLSELRQPLLRYLWALLAMTLAVQPLLLPLSLYLFGESSLAFLWTTLLVVPLSALLIPTSLLIFLLLPLIGTAPIGLLAPLEWGAGLMREGVALAEGIPALMLHYPLALGALLLYYLLLALAFFGYRLYREELPAVAY
ncbi:MAG: ComEC/Rec2 family competence protein [Porphyromonadaceae bacterium]|nr:ComEC/Rec2 family competence protein [Porphyromonadaceae bacterium]